jgi:hypothetical protein
VKSLSSSRREVLLDCFHVYTCHIGYLLPGSAVLQHPVTRSTPRSHTRRQPPISLLPRCCQPCARNENIKRDIYRAFLIAFYRDRHQSLISNGDAVHIQAVIPYLVVLSGNLVISQHSVPRSHLYSR